MSIKENGQCVHMIDVVCSKCGLVYKNPCMPKDRLIEYYKSERYLEDYKPEDIDQISKTQIDNESMNSVHRLDFLDNLDADLKGKSILDVGSASGSSTTQNRPGLIHL